MKIRASTILIALSSLYLITSMYGIEQYAVVFAFMRLFRLACLPLFLFFIAFLLPKQPSRKFKSFLPMILPIVALLTVNTIQVTALPPGLAATHTSFSVRFTALFLLYIATLLAINNLSANKLINTLLVILIAIFFVGIAHYPQIIARSGASIGAALSNYGQIASRYQLSGFFGSSNEDANGMMTIFPLVLLWIERKKGLWKNILRVSIFAIFAIVLLFNGTRTALVISMPFITFLFYSDMSLKKAMQMALLGLVAGAIAAFLGGDLIGRVFGDEADGGGTLGWRIEHAWLPAIHYTLAHSPLFGFGSRGWEYICYQLEIFTPWVDGFLPAPAPAHSGYVWTLASWGFLGLAAYVSFIAALAFEAFKLSQVRDYEISLPGKALFCSMMGYCLWALVSNVMMSQGWIILFCLAMLIAAYKFIYLSEYQTLAYEESFANPEEIAAPIYPSSAHAPYWIEDARYR